MSKFVQIRDDQVVTLCPCAQDPEYWPDVIEVDDDDPRFVAFLTRIQAILAGEPIEGLTEQALAKAPDQNADQPT
jgi:hypothetical protein